MSTMQLARRACRLFRDGYMPKEIRHANCRKWIAAVQRLGDKWLLAVPVKKGGIHDGISAATAPPMGRCGACYCGSAGCHRDHGAAMNNYDEQVQMVSDCMNRESKLTDWERGFIDSLSNQLAEGRSLSEKQTERLDEIWERVT